jgi:hypothetical protein
MERTGTGHISQMRMAANDTTHKKVACRFFITRRNAALHGANRRTLGAGWSFELGKAILDQMSLFVLMFIERP